MVWTVDSVSDLTGKVVIVTGATSGIGLEAARIFLRSNATLVMASRSVEKMARVAEELQRDNDKAPPIVQLQLDTSDLASVRSFDAAFRATGLGRIDVLLLNAGALVPDRAAKSPQGFDLMFATNHLGHWLLAGLLLDLYRDVAGSRVIAVSSAGHRGSRPLDFDVLRGDPTATGPNDMFGTYTMTKLANLLFVENLRARLNAAGAATAVAGCHPGFSRTDFAREMEGTLTLNAFQFFFGWASHDAVGGALPLVMAATDPELTPAADKYYGPGNLFEMKGPPISNGTCSELVKDQQMSEELWKVSEELTGFKYAI